MKASHNMEWHKNTFLASVATDLNLRFGNDMTNVTVVFPNKRARLFLNEEFLALTEKPLWAPQYTTIGDLFSVTTGEHVSELIPAVCTLYHIYKGLLGMHAETLDMFWGWGEIILSDFDDIDKHLVNADALFTNARELEEMESLDFLTQAQREALERFFGSFTPENKTRIQERFSELWAIMPELYHGLTTAMPAGISPYQGALERKVVEDSELLASLDSSRTFCFVGFNMLSETEKKLMSYLDSRRQALFYWDYDAMYKDNCDFEAGDFIRENIKLFPNALAHSGIYDNLRHKQELTFVSTSTDSIATRYVPGWLTDRLTATERETALVLCDEQQLQPVLHSIPDTEHADTQGCPKDINVTMGYALTGTPVYSLIMALIALQTDGWDEKRSRFLFPFLKTIKYHPYSTNISGSLWEKRVNPNDIPALVSYLDAIVMELASKIDENECFDDILTQESLYLMHKALRQFHDMATDEVHPLHLLPATLRRLLRRILGSQSIPFHGEPARGLQVMGVLETRCLDFRNILMLNVGEGFLPKNGMDNSLIPYTLRTGFGLTTIRHRTAVYAYYFYRLIQRAEHVTFVFNENSSGTIRHEMSRFLRQLQAETDIPIRCLRMEAEQDATSVSLDDVIKTDDILQALHSKYNLNINPNACPLSPSSINRYLDCPMKFYLTSVCNIRVTQDPEDGIDARLMGNIFHNAAERIYGEILSHTTDSVITRAHLSEYTANKGRLIQPVIDRQFAEDANIREFRGENILIREVIERYLLNLLRWDERHAPITMKAMEEDVTMEITVDVDGNSISVLTGGRVDRMDIICDDNGERHLRILDYKTGTHMNDVRNFNTIFKRDHTHAGYYLQTFLYALAVKKGKETGLPVKPVLFYPAHAGRNDYNPTLLIGGKRNASDTDSGTSGGAVNDIVDYENDFVENLKEVIQEIFSPHVAFCKTTNKNACKYCDFKQLCNNT